MALFALDPFTSEYGSMLRTLLAAPEYRHAEEWGVAVLDAADALFQVDHGLLVVPLPDRLLVRGLRIAPNLLARLVSLIGDLEPGVLHLRDPALERAMQSRRAAGTSAWSFRSLSHGCEIDLEREPVYRDLLEPAGLGNGAGVTVGLPHGEAMLVLGASTRPGDERGGAAMMYVLEMLAPGLEFGARAAFGASLREAGGLEAAAQEGDELLPLSAVWVKSNFPLTLRESEVAALLAGGLSDREIGERLGLSPRTVHHHVEHIFDKLDIHGRKAFALRLHAIAAARPSSERGHEGVRGGWAGRAASPRRRTPATPLT